MEARLARRGPTSLPWGRSGVVPVAWICVGAALGRGAALSGLAGLGPALLLGAIALRARAAEGSVPEVLRAWVPHRLGLIWAVALAAGVGVATAGTARATLALGAVLLVLAASAGVRLPAVWRVVLTAFLCATVPLWAEPGLHLPRLAAAVAWQALTGGVLASSAWAAVAGTAPVWILLGAAWAGGGCAAACGQWLGGGVAAFLVALLTLFLASDPGSGALSGAVAGFVCLPVLSAGGFAPGIAALGGAAAGLARTWRRRWAAPAYALATAAMAAVAVPAPWPWCAGAVAAAGLWLAARRAPRSAPTALQTPVPRPPALEERLRVAAATCLELSRSLAEVPIQTVDESERGLRMAEEVCPGCPALQACWERKLPRARSMVLGLWRSAQEGPVTWQAVGGPETIFCLRPREMAEAANRHAALQRQREEFLHLLAGSRRAAVTPLVGIGRVLADLAEDVAASREPAEWMGEAPPDPGPARERWMAPAATGRFGYEAVAVTLPRAGGALSGDSLRCRALPGERLVLALADGMGSGGPAAVTSAAAAEHLLASLDSGRDVERALGQTNGHLVGDSSAERFAAISLTVVQLRGGLLEWYAMGSPPGFLLHARGVRQWGGGGLPIGILSLPEIRSGRLRLRGGDSLVLVSDGILDRLPGGTAPRARGDRVRWALDWLRQARLRGGGPEDWAAGLLAAARARAAADHDDLTVLVCRFFLEDDTEGGPGGGTAYATAGAAGPGGARIPPVATR